MGQILTAALRRGYRGVTLLLLATLAFLMAGAGDRAHAHAVLVGAEPADGAVVASPPQRFRLTFNEPTSPLVLKLVNPDGSSTVLNDYGLRDATLDVVAPPALAPGTHVLSWRVVSEDGHPIGGSLIFSIGAPSAGGFSAPKEAVDSALRAAIWLARMLLYVGLFIGVGGVFFVRLVGGGEPTVRIIQTGAILLGLLAAGLSLGLQGLDALDLPLASLPGALPWRTGLATSYGRSALIAAAALIAGLVALHMPARAGRLLAALALGGAGAAWAASGHASAVHPQWLTRSAVFLHGVGIAYWTGALPPLAVGLARATPQAPTLLHRFSKTIPLALLPLLAAGIVLALVQIDRPAALWMTAYGRVLIAKLGLVALLLVLAAVNRMRLTARAERAEALATRHLVGTIRAELVLVIAIFAVAALWRFTPPPRALAEAAAAPTQIHIHTAKAMADVMITPGHIGRVSATTTIMTGDFGPLDAKGVTLVFSKPEAGIEPIRRPATRGTDAVWRVGDLDLPLPGRWHIRVDILVSDFELVKLQDTIDIRP